jgi:hypothetical protein
LELGNNPDPKRVAWRKAVAELATKPIERKGEINA